MRFFDTFFTVSMVSMAMAQSCYTPDGSGACMWTSQCGGSSVPGYCPGGTDYQCCVEVLSPASSLSSSNSSCSTPYGSGSCEDTSSCSSKGFSVAGYCPGAANIQCCISSTCYTSSGSGTCKSTSSGCSGGAFVAGACPGSDSIQCCVDGASGGGGGGSGGSGGSGDLPGLDSTQSSHAWAIIGESQDEGLGHQGCLAGIATAITESNIKIYASEVVPESLNYPHDAVGSDHDSIGIFQQRAMYYPDIAADMDPARSAAQFFAKMKDVDGWESMDVGELCQTVQVSAYPDRYNEHVPEAEEICSAGGA